MGFMPQTTGQGISNFLGEYLGYDEKNGNNFLRIRILIDVWENIWKKQKKSSNLEEIQ